VPEPVEHVLARHGGHAAGSAGLAEAHAAVLPEPLHAPDATAPSPPSAAGEFRAITPGEAAAAAANRSGAAGVPAESLRFDVAPAAPADNGAHPTPVDAAVGQGPGDPPYPDSVAPSSGAFSMNDATRSRCSRVISGPISTPAWSPAPTLIVSGEVGLDHVVRLARRRHKSYRGPPVKSAFYAVRVISLTIARLYEELMQGSRIQVRTFRDCAAAAKWLGVPTVILQPPKTEAK